MKLKNIVEHSLRWNEFKQLRNSFDVAEKDYYI